MHFSNETTLASSLTTSCHLSDTAGLVLNFNFCIHTIERDEITVRDSHDKYCSIVA